MVCRRDEGCSATQKLDFLGSFKAESVRTGQGRSMTDPFMKPCTVAAILFDFGGVLAEEGFRNGLLSIARRNQLEPEPFAKTGFEIVFKVGYVIGRSDESTFWQALREQTGIRDNDDTLRKEILSHFRLRAWMIELVKQLKQHNVSLAILSDQTNWLDELDNEHRFFQFFDHVFNSYHMGKSKKDSSLFDDVLRSLRTDASHALFVDDHEGNIQRAKQRGLHTILYSDPESFRSDLAQFCPDIVAATDDGLN